MKIIKIEIQETPKNYQRPYIERMVFPKISPKIFTEVDVISYKDTMEVTKDLYELDWFGFGDMFKEGFYIRKKDKEAFEGLFKAFLDREKLLIIRGIINYAKKNPDQAFKNILDIASELEKNLTVKERIELDE